MWGLVLMAAMAAGDAGPPPPAAADYVVIGSGPGGGAVAHFLTKGLPATASVVVLEAGTADAHAIEDNRHPFACIKAISNASNLFHAAPEQPWQGVPQAALSNRTLALYSPRILGGASAMNAGMWVRPTRGDIELWNVPGWTPAVVHSTLNDIEATLGGFYSCETASPMRDFMDQARGVPPRNCNADWLTADQVNQYCGSQLGLTATKEFGLLRYTAYHNLLKPLLHSHNHLQVFPGCTVTKLIVDPDTKRATHVQYLKDGNLFTITVNKEVVLAAGPFQNPKILKLSGVGPAAELERLGIHVVVDSPNVGEHLQDHPLVPLFFNRTGDLAFNLSPKTSYLVPRWDFSGSPGAILPEFQLFFLEALPDGLPPVPGVDMAHGAAIFAVVLNPKSTGSVRLAAADYATPPLVDHGFLTAPEDADALVRVIDVARKHFKTDSNENLVEVLPGSAFGDNLEPYVRLLVSHGWHPTSSVRMGTDPATSAVDPELRLRGLANVRVADSSAFPDVPRFFFFFFFFFLGG